VEVDRFYMTLFECGVAATASVYAGHNAFSWTASEHEGLHGGNTPLLIRDAMANSLFWTTGTPNAGKDRLPVRVGL
jgi:hypothetical protein